ncbi:MAG: antibiotic biosynthesis monooxygenase [Gammaproteobacteria bacterium]|nr:antibiotic biosynthesis monooxygenase [Gammaproteobacteria bacterium]
MSIRVVAEVEIKRGRVDEFKTIAAEVIQRVEANEPRTWTYEWYLNEDESKCYVLEHYADSAATMAHMENVGPLLDRFFETCSIDNLSLFGEVSAEVREAFAALNPSVFEHWSGVSRELVDANK